MAEKKNILNLSDKFINSLSKIEHLKLPLIFIGDVIFTIAFLTLGCFLIYAGLAMREYLPVGILALINAFIYLIAIILIKKEKLHLSALISTIGIVFACMIILDFCPPSDQSLVYYRSGCFVAVMAVCNQIVSLRRRQIIIFNSSILVIWVIMCILTVPYTYYDTVGTISAIGINTLGDFISLLLISFANRFNNTILEGEISAEQEAKKNLSSITHILEESRNGLSVGQKLVDETQKAGSNISKLDTLYSGISKAAADLSDDSETITQSSTDVLNSAEKMQATLSRQNILINETSGALMDISDSISNLSGMAEQRSSNMKGMLDNLSSEKELITQIVKEVQQVQESSEGIAGFVQTVNAIATRTNLLAMNASIEAAHAGIVGKGFSVIAHEIRNLSEQTSKNAAHINEELEKNAELVKSTTASVESFNQYIQNATKEMEETIEMMEQLLSGIQAIDTENSKVMVSLKNVVNQSSETNVLAENVVSEITAQDQTLSKMRSLAEELKTNVNAMNYQLKDIQDVISVIDTEAHQNIEVSKKINNYLE